jgi:hypothetical protein
MEPCNTETAGIVTSPRVNASALIATGRQGILPIGNDSLSVNQILSSMHYLGPINRGTPYRDEFGVLILANPSSRRLPQSRWLELVRWCLFGTKNGGSQQWKRVCLWLRKERPDVTTVVSYSDPSVGHTGALYRASNWRWAPTWHRLRTPPSGNGKWSAKGKVESVKDRWIFCLQPDVERERILAVQDASLVRRFPWAQFTEQRGGDYKRWKQAVDLDVLSGDAGKATTGLDAPSVSERS